MAGIDYMHSFCKPPIVHRDIKTRNILLNEHFEAKLGDFGLSRLFSREDANHISTMVAGTPGYLDPEYATFLPCLALLNYETILKLDMFYYLMLQIQSVISAE